ncbi:hypothetical protein H0H10_20245 [Streptomyces sp. TRM S81-3]|uniref:DUF7824 domain-containing protein n=1 Tax=Streptomyces griseicoloratus TaxID=2752516 RepID=A0A926L7D7_9ACTN|nr:hypothetical protein [Streptomyces griseicoloratus]
MEAVRAGRTDEVVRLLDGMTDAERRAHFPALKALRKELRTASSWSAESRRAHPALHAAGAACQTGAAAVASWLSGTDMRWSQAAPAVLIDVLGDRDPDWLADVVHRLARRPVGSNVPYELMAGLVRLAGCPVPTTEAYVRGWMTHISQSRPRGGTLCDRLRRDPHLAQLVPAFFEIDDIGSQLRWLSGDGPHSWTKALAELTAEGTLDRRATVDACVARLLRGGSAADHRVFLDLLRDLALTRDEQRQRTADWAALASDAVSVVASHAQSVLGALALDGELTPRLLAETTEGVLFRPEKKLVRAQLVLVGKVLTREASVAGELLPAVARAFAHEDSDVQERALKLVERHIGKVTAPEVRDELAEAAGELIPALRVRAAGSLGAGVPEPEPVVYEELLPPAPEPVRLAPAPGSAAELAEEVNALMASGADVAAFERTLDGLVRHVHRDRDALLDTLEPLIARRWWGDPSVRHDLRATDWFGRYHHLLDPASSLDLLLATLRGKVITSALEPAPQGTAPDGGCVHDALARAVEARLWEVAHRIRTEPLPFLLSTPTWSTGLLEPDELVDRLDAYRRLGARVAAVDFGHALLRVRRGDRAAAVTAARRAAALGTEEGTRLARWLTAEGPARPASRRTSGPRVLIELDELPGLRDGLPAPLKPLGGPVSVFRDRWYCRHWNADVRGHWPALLPELPELVAARILRDVSTVAVDDDRGAAAALPRLAEADGEAGGAVHLCVAYGLGARHAQDRLAAVDALLVLAARGRLDPGLLGADLGQLARHGAVKPVRLAESLRTAAATGANATIWGVLRHTLPVLLADLATDGTVPSARGLGDLLAVAAECAERSGARGELPHLARAADRRGSSRLVAQARRLRSALTDGTAAA